MLERQCSSNLSHDRRLSSAQPKYDTCVLFPELFDRPLVTQFDLANARSDGGAVLLKAADARLGLIEELSRSVRDGRMPGKLDHQLPELLSQRIFGLACGYADCNDAARLAHDPVHKMLVGHDPVMGDSLASQPTISRLENAAGPRDLYRIGETLVATLVDRHRLRLGRTCRQVVIDLDPTVDPTHGAQQLSLFHGSAAGPLRDPTSGGFPNRASPELCASPVSCPCHTETGSLPGATPSNDHVGCDVAEHPSLC